MPKILDVQPAEIVVTEEVPGIDDKGAAVITQRCWTISMQQAPMHKDQLGLSVSQRKQISDKLAADLAAANEQ